MQGNVSGTDTSIAHLNRADLFADTGATENIHLLETEGETSSIEEEWLVSNPLYSTSDTGPGAVLHGSNGVKSEGFSGTIIDRGASSTVNHEMYEGFERADAFARPTREQVRDMKEPTDHIKQKWLQYDDNQKMESARLGSDLPPTPHIDASLRLPKLQITTSPDRVLSVRFKNEATSKPIVKMLDPPTEIPTSATNESSEIDIQINLCDEDNDDDWIDPAMTQSVTSKSRKPEEPKPSLFKPSLFKQSPILQLDTSFGSDNLQQEPQDSLSDGAPHRKRLRKASSDAELLEQRFSDDKIAAEFDEMLGESPENDRSDSYEIVEGRPTELDMLLGDDAPKRRRRKRKVPELKPPANQNKRRKTLDKQEDDDLVDDIIDDGDDFIENDLMDDYLYEDDDLDEDDRELLADVAIDDEDDDFKNSPGASKRRTRSTFAKTKKSTQSKLNFGVGDDDLVDDGADTPSKKKKKRKPRNSAIGYLDANGTWVVDDEIVEEDLGEEEEVKPEIENEQIEEVGDLVLSAAGESPAHIVPAAINNRLRQYQRDGVKFLYSLFKKDIGGILGDDMGLGKTIQTIAFIYGIFPPKPNANTDSVNNSWIGQSPVKSEQKPEVIKKQPPKHMPVLIVVPGSVLYNWQKEFKAWGRIADRQFSLYMHHGTNRRATKNSLQAKDVVLTTYDIFRIEFDLFDSVDWLCIIFDEVHKIKDRKTKLAKTCNRLRHMRRFGLTGTVVQNNFEELYTLLDFVQPGSLGTLHQFRYFYINPIKNGQKQDASFRDIAFRKHTVRKLNLEFKKIVLRRDKSVIRDLLPQKTDNIVFCKMSDTQIAVYKRVMESESFAFMLKWVSRCPCGLSDKIYGKCCATETFDFKEHLFPAINNLMKVSNDLRLIIPKPELDENSPQFKRESEFFATAVGLDKKKLDDLVREKNNEELNGKLKSLRLLVDIWDQKGKKVLIFSSKTTLLDIIQRFLIKFISQDRISRLDGATPIAQRQDILDDYSSEPQKRRFLFLISTKAGGLGLNITSAHTVVVFDPSWNATWDLQAQDRVHRIGQTKNTEIYRFISQGSIEETIYNRQIYKQQMANISTQGSHERRFFKGVQGRRGEEGELFGLVNLLKFASDRIFTKEVVENEQQYVIKALEEAGAPADPQENPLLSEVFAADADAVDADEIQLDGVYDLSALGRRVHTGAPPVGEEIQSALLRGGVEYLHNNQRLVGNSKVEEFITSQAMKLHVDDVETMESEVARSSSRGSLANSGFLFGGDLGVGQEDHLRRRLAGEDSEDSDDALVLQSPEVPSWANVSPIDLMSSMPQLFDMIASRRSSPQSAPAEQTAMDIAWLQNLKRQHAAMRKNVAERKFAPNQYKNYIVPAYKPAIPPVPTQPMMSKLTSREYKQSNSNSSMINLVSPEKPTSTVAIDIADEDSDDLMILETKPSPYSQSFTQPLYQTTYSASPERRRPSSLRTEPNLSLRPSSSTTPKKSKSQEYNRKTESAPKLEVINLIDD